MDGRAYLEKLIADRLATSQERSLDAVPRAFDLSQIRGVAVGLVAAEVLAQEEMESIITELEQRLERMGWLTRKEFRVAADPQLAALPVAARPELAIASSRYWSQPASQPPDLEEVISLAGHVLAIGDATAILISLERWSTMLVLRLAYADPDRRLLHDRGYSPRERWHGWDDVGTQYQGRGVGGTSGPGLYSERLVFQPGAPDEARTLTLSVDREGETRRLTVALGDGGRRG
jgi:hypothetical protein